MPEGKKRGRRPDYVKDTQGNDIVGMHKFFNKQRDCWVYYSWVTNKGKKQKKYWGTNYGDAVGAHATWELKKEQEPVSTYVVPESSKEEVLIAQGQQVLTYQTSPIDFALEGETSPVPPPPPLETHIPESTKLQILKELFAQYKPAQLSRLLKIDIEYSLPKPSSMIADDVLQLYLDAPREKAILPKTIYDNSTWWKEFILVVGTNKIRAITQQDVATYKAKIFKDKEKGEKSLRYISNRFGAVKAIVNIALENGMVEYRDDLEQLQKHISILAKAKDPMKNPCPMTQGNFKKCIEWARATNDLEWELRLSISMNMGFTPKDTVDLQWSDIWMDKKEIVMIREKTGKLRVGKMFNRTYKLLKQWEQVKPDETYVFKKVIPKSISEHFRRRIRKDAKLEKQRSRLGHMLDCSYDSIKDAVKSVPVNEADFSTVETNFLCGHSFKGEVSDNYLSRLPKRTAKVVMFLEEWFFDKNGL